MSYINSRRFIILSNNINSSNDVFDRLIDVKDSVTGEEGMLLCSHMCSFPSNLVNQAKWLAGCKPTSKWENDDRLALGFHPNHYIQWRVFKETNEIELYLTGSFDYQQDEDEDDEHQWFYTNLPYIGRCFTTNDGWHQVESQVHANLFNRSLIRLVERIFVSGVNQESLDSFECLIHRLFNSGKIDAWTATVFPSSILNRNISNRINSYPYIHWEGEQSMFFDKETWIIETGEHLECTLVPYIDGGYQSKIEVLFQQQYTLSNEFYTQREEACSSLPLTDRDWYSRQVF